MLWAAFDVEDEGRADARISCACSSRAACLFRRSSRAPALSTAGLGGSGGGPVPWIGETVAGEAAVEWMCRAASGRELGPCEGPAWRAASRRAIRVGGFMAAAYVGCIGDTLR